MEKLRFLAFFLAVLLLAGCSTGHPELERAMELLALGIARYRKEIMGIEE